MVRWTGVILVPSGDVNDAMASRLPAWLHPVAGRPLVWHLAAGLAELDPAPDRILVLGGPDLPAQLFDDIRDVPVETLVDLPPGRVPPELRSLEDGHCAVVAHAAASLSPGTLRELMAGPVGRWLPAATEGAAAAWVDGSGLRQILRLPIPLAAPSGALAALDRLAAPDGALVVQNRIQLAEAAIRTRDRLVRNLMLSGATFILPDSVLVDVDVRIGRDSVVYPGVVLEGQTTIGEETVIGPGCRIVDSWIGSGVELKGWNYISHTSIRNRAILEPHVRRGFD